VYVCVIVTMDAVVSIYLLLAEIEADYLLLFGVRVCLFVCVVFLKATCDVLIYL